LLWCPILVENELLIKSQIKNEPSLIPQIK
jgi:hypothetical protein